MSAAPVIASTNHGSWFTSCRGKVAHPSSAAAMDVLLRQRRQHDDEKLTAYRCRFCGLWHIGHAQ